MYDLIYTDPPWPRKKGGLRKARPNQGRLLDYATMNLDNIFAVHRNVMGMAKPDHAVFIWAIDKFLPETERRMTELGYKLHARLIWDKENGVAPAFTVRYSHEYLLWYYRGKMQPVATEARGKYCTVLRERSVRHSQKPDCAYRLIEALYPTATRLEMYARATRPGWDSWGNEVESTVQIQEARP